ncbi:MAG: SIP domain-containing protein [Mycetocola sp.]
MAMNARCRCPPESSSRNRSTNGPRSRYPDAAFEQDLDAPAGVRVRWVHRGPAPESAILSSALESLTEVDRPAGDVFAFVAAEQSIVRPGRALLFERWNLDAATAIVKGYWKRGEAEYHAPH